MLHNTTDSHNGLSSDIYQAKYHICQTIMRYIWSDKLSDQRIRREPKGIEVYIRTFGGL